VHISPEALVIGQVVAIVIGVLVEDDIVAVPAPAIAITELDGSDSERKAVEPEAPGSAAFDAPYMARTETASEVPVLPGMIKMKTDVVAAGVMSHP
jgi:hypothetical protein